MKSALKSEKKVSLKRKYQGTEKKMQGAKERRYRDLGKF